MDKILNTLMNILITATYALVLTGWVMVIEETHSILLWLIGSTALIITLAIAYPLFKENKEKQ